MRLKLINFILILFLSSSITSHEIDLENKTIEEIVNNRMKKMSIINNLSQKIYKGLKSEDFESLEENSINLKHAAMDFKKSFPADSKGGNAKELIWVNKILFDEYNDKFLNDINSMLVHIENQDIDLLKQSFNKMSSNCSSCHKKFKNK